MRAKSESITAMTNGLPEHSVKKRTVGPTHRLTWFCHAHGRTDQNKICFSDIQHCSKTGTKFLQPTVCIPFSIGCGIASWLCFAIDSYSVRYTFSSNQTSQPLFWWPCSMDFFVNKQYMHPCAFANIFKMSTKVRRTLYVSLTSITLAFGIDATRVLAQWELLC